MTDLFILSHFYQYASDFREISGIIEDRTCNGMKKAVTDDCMRREKKSYRQIEAHFVWEA